MSSVYAQKNKEKQKKRAFGRDLTNRVNNEENSLENIKKEIKDTLDNLKKSQSSNPNSNISNQQYPSNYSKKQSQNHLLSYSEVALNGYGARQNFQKQKFEKKISKKVSLTDLQFDCYGVKALQSGGQMPKIGPKSKMELQKNLSKGGNIQNYLAHTSLRRVEKQMKKGSSQKKFLNNLGRNVPVSKPDSLSKMDKLISKARIGFDEPKKFQKSEPECYKRPPMLSSKSSNKCMKIEMGTQRAKVSVDKKPRAINQGLLDSSRVMKEESFADSQEASGAEEESLDYLRKRKNPQCVESYQADIFDFCMKTEVNNLCKSNYFVLKQKFINDKMRAILIDWLIDVHNKFKMIPQTFFLTVNLIDRYLEIYECERDKLQLVGISCLFLSSKYEEIYPPDLVEFVKVCDNTYTSDEIIQMESCILGSLNFDLIFTSSYQFHEMFCQKLNIKDQPFHLSLFLLFLSTMEFSMARFRPSQIALSAIYLSNKFLKLDKWRPELPHVIGCTEQEIKNCALDLFLLVHKVKRSNLSAVTRRFASRKHMCVSKIQIKL